MNRSFLLKRLDNTSKFFVGKLNDINFAVDNLESTRVNKLNNNSFQLMLNEEKIDKDKKLKTIEKTYTGNLMSDQTANYLIFNISNKAKSNSLGNSKEATEIIEVVPASEWFHFSKDLGNAITADELEEKRRKELRDQLNTFKFQTKPKVVPKKEEKPIKTVNKINLGVNKKTINNQEDEANNPDLALFNKIFDDEKKDLEKKEISNLNKMATKRANKNFEESSDEDEKVFSKKRKTKTKIKTKGKDADEIEADIEAVDEEVSERNSYKMFEESNPELVKNLNNNPNSEDISNLANNLLPKEKKIIKTKKNTNYVDLFNDDEEEESAGVNNSYESSSGIGDDEQPSNTADNLNSIGSVDDMEFDELAKREEESTYLNKKRGREDNNFKISLEDALKKMFLRHKSLTLKDIMKELGGLNFTINEIRENLSMLLDKKFSKFKNSNEEDVYYMK